MPDPLVETKLLVPLRAPGRWHARRLDELLSRGRAATLMLVSAPAGFGKTTLLGSWLAARRARARSTAWVSLDERDRDPSSFWTYVLLAVDRAVPGDRDRALGQLQAGQVPVEAVLTALLNELSVLPDDVDAGPRRLPPRRGPRHPSRAWPSCVDHLPPQVHLVISTRADPALPLARLRARGELVEVRAADLRFTGDEAAAYLNDINALGLDADDVAALETRTEGWAAALQLAALSLRGRDDASQFIAGFAGDDRFVVDYLADEVLDRQPPDVRRFLLDTSVLDRLTGPLCDAVTGRTDGKAMLESLERQNLFLVPLDDQRRWYRYHHLFADVLQRAPARRTARRRRRAAPSRQRLVRPGRGSRGGGPARTGRRRRRPGRRPGRARDPGAAPRATRSGHPPLDRRRCPPTSSSEPTGARRRVRRRPGGAATSSTASSGGCADVERLLGRVRSTDLVVARRGRAGAAARGDRDLPRRRSRSSAATWPAPWSTPSARWPAPPEDDDLTLASASALVGLASWTAGDLDAAHRGVHRRRRGPAHAPGTSPTSSAAPSRSPTSR